MAGFDADETDRDHRSRRETRRRVLAFDSGVGGLSIVREIAAAGLAVDVDFLADTDWFPYGDRADADLVARVPDLLARAVGLSGADLAIIACNTASTLALDAARAALDVPVVGVVPAIKPAAEATRTGVIGLLATPRTIVRPYTEDLIARLAPDAHVIRHGPPDLARAAEATLAGRARDEDVVRAAVAGLFEAPRGGEIDVVVLACTHYPLLGEALAAHAPRPVRWIDSGAAIARRTAALLALTPRAGTMRRGAAWTTGGADADFTAAARREGFDPIGRLPA